MEGTVVLYACTYILNDHLCFLIIFTFSGVALYGIGRQSQGIGLSISVDKDFMTWKTSPFSPVITTPTSINASYVGDPYIWKVCT